MNRSTPPSSSPNSFARAGLLCVTAAVAVLGGGCTFAGHLRPAAEAQRVPGRPDSAVGSDAGVRLVAETDAWRGDPPTLADAVIPVRITIENGSTHPLRVRYSEFTLRGPALDYRPLPPRKLVDRTVTVKEDAILVPRIVSQKFRVAPYRYPNFPGIDVWDLPWEDNPDFYTRQYAKWTVPLPTVEMIDRALPEGVIDPGGRLTGFLYFEPLHEKAREIRFDFDLVDAKSQLDYGRIRIPFVRR